MVLKRNVTKSDKVVRKSHKRMEKMMKSDKLVKHCLKLAPKDNTKEWKSDKKWQTTKKMSRTSEKSHKNDKLVKNETN